MTEPIPGSVVPPPPEPPEPRRSRRHTVVAVVLSTVGVLLAVVAVAGFLIHLPYVIISPGSATPLDSSVVRIDGAQTYPHDESVRFLTVRVSTHDPNVWRVVTSWLDPDRAVEPRDDVVGCLSDEQNVVFNTELMDQSQNDAKYVALTRLGYSVQADPAQIRVVEVCRESPAHEKLQTGDQILAVDGTDVGDVTEVGELVQAHRPGDDVQITFDRNGTTRTTTVVAGKASKDRLSCVEAKGSTTGTTCVGISSQEFTTYQIPGQREDQHPAGRGSLGRARLHPGDHRRHDAGQPHGRPAGRSHRHHRAHRLGRRGRRGRAEGDHRAHERCPAHARSEEGGQSRSARSGRRARRGGEEHRGGIGRVADSGRFRSAAIADDRGAIMRA